MTDDDELINFEREIPELRKELSRLHDHLRLALKDIGEPKEVGERLVSHAEEFGIDAATDKLLAEPSVFGVDQDSLLLNRANLTKIADLVDQTYTTDQDLSRLVDARETILIERDPAHVRVRNVAGREAVFDFTGRSLRYLDDGLQDDLNVSVVEPTGFPERMPSRVQPRRDKFRDR